MADIVNLRSARKRKARAQKEQAADASRLLHGRTKAERERLAAIEARARTDHDGHRRIRPGEDGGA